MYMIIYVQRERERERFPWLSVGRGGEGRISLVAPTMHFGQRF